MADERFESEEPYDSLAYSDFGDGLAVAVERCPLCVRSRLPFHCAECVKSGVFCRSSDGPEYGERYCDLQERLKSATQERVQLTERIRKTVASKEERAAKRDQIEELKKQIRLLKWSIQEARKRKVDGEKYYAKQCASNSRNGEKLSKSHSLLAKMHAAFTSNKEQLHLSRQDLQHRTRMLQEQRSQVINDLVTYIFPVVEITGEGATNASLCLEASSLLMSTARALSEACQLTYMSGRWVHTDRYGKSVIKIVESTLPGNGDYSAGVTSEHQELASLAEDNQRLTAGNATYAVISGLCHTTQLMHILASILCVQLPRKLSYNMFGCKDFSEKNLQQVVSRLNHNVLQLCFSQGLDSSQIFAKHTMHNLLRLLTSEHLGRSGPYEEQVEMVEMVNDGCDSEVDEADCKDELDAPPQDWDFVSRGDIPEIPMPPIHESPSIYGKVLTGTQSTTSDLFTSAAASITSLWRTATWGTGKHGSSDANS